MLQGPQDDQTKQNKMDNCQITSIFQEAYVLQFSSMDNFTFPLQWHCNDTIETAFSFSGHYISFWHFTFASNLPDLPLETQNSTSFFFPRSSFQNASLPITNLTEDYWVS